MQKINEILDLSEKVLDIEIDSPVFEKMLDDLNKEIQRVIQSVYDGEFASGEISVKLNLEIIEAFEEIPTVDEFGNMINELYKYKKPKFEHKITSTLKKQSKREGCYSDKKEVVWDGEKYVVKPLVNPQTQFNITVNENEDTENEYSE